MSLVSWDWFHWASKIYSSKFKFFWIFSNQRNINLNFYYYYFVICNPNSIYWRSPSVSQKIEIESIMEHLLNRHCLLKFISNLTICYNQLESRREINQPEYFFNPKPQLDVDNIFSKFSKDQWKQLLSRVEYLDITFQGRMGFIEIVNLLMNHGLEFSNLKIFLFVAGINYNQIAYIMKLFLPILKNVETLSIVSTMEWGEDISKDLQFLSKLIVSRSKIQNLSLDIEVINQILLDFPIINSNGNYFKSLNEITVSNCSNFQSPNTQLNNLNLLMSFPNVNTIHDWNPIKSRSYPNEMLKILNDPRITSFGTNIIEFHPIMSDALYQSKLRELFINIDHENIDQSLIKIQVQSLESFGFQFIMNENEKYNVCFENNSSLYREKNSSFDVHDTYYAENSKKSDITIHILNQLLPKNNNNTNPILKNLCIQYLDNPTLYKILEVVNHHQQLQQLYLIDIKYSFTNETSQKFYQILSNHQSLRVLYIDISEYSLKSPMNFLLSNPHIDVFTTVFLRFIVEAFPRVVCNKFKITNISVHFLMPECDLIRFTRRFTYLPDMGISQLEKRLFKKNSPLKYKISNLNRNPK